MPSQIHRLSDSPRAIGHHDCTRIVDDFITAQTTQRPAQPAS
jgi:hypothetical protein